MLAICKRYVELALERADFSQVTALAIDETSRAKGHDCITRAADAVERRVVVVTEGRDATTVATIADELAAHGCPPERIKSVSIDMSPAFIKGCAKSLPDARITFDKFHVVWHANAAVDKTRRVEQRSDPVLRPAFKGMRWTLLKDAFSLSAKAGAALHDLIRAPQLTRTARAWVYKERLREILDRKQINVMRRALTHWCGCVMRSKVEPMKVSPHSCGVISKASSPRRTRARPTGFSKHSTGCFKPPSVALAAIRASRRSRP